MINQKILVSGAEYFANTAKINPYYKSESISLHRAIAEHQTLVRAFKSAGITVHQVPAPATSQDGVYTANWALIRNGKAVLANLPAVRATETAHAAKVLKNLDLKLIRLPQHLKFSGQGDSLPCGKYLFAGSGYRSDPEAQALTAQALGLELIELHTIPKLDAANQPVINPATGWPDSFFYDLDLALAVIRTDLIAYCPAAFDAPSRRKIARLPLEKIEVSLAEAQTGFACNLLSTGETVIMSAHAPELQSALRARGLKIIPIDAPELKKGGGFIRCVSLTLD